MQLHIPKVACSKVLRGPSGGEGIVVGCDLLDIEPVEGAHLIPFADFTEEATQSKEWIDSVPSIFNFGCEVQLCSV